MSTINQATATASAAPSFPVFWNVLGRLVVGMLGQRAHGDVIITLKDGKVQLVRVHRSYLPADLPQV